MFAGVAAIAIVVAACVALWPTDPFAGRDFDRNVWDQFADVYVSDNPRASMLADLRENYLTIGMTKQAVVDLLGEPEFKHAGDVYWYVVGMWSGSRMDQDALHIYFDNNGNLSNTACVQH